MRALHEFLKGFASGLGWVVIFVTLLQAVGLVDVLIYIGPAASVQVEQQPRKTWT